MFFHAVTVKWRGEKNPRKTKECPRYFSYCCKACNTGVTCRRRRNNVGWSGPLDALRTDTHHSGPKKFARNFVAERGALRVYDQRGVIVSESYHYGANVRTSRRKRRSRASEMMTLHTYPLLRKGGSIDLLCTERQRLRRPIASSSMYTIHIRGRFCHANRAAKLPKISCRYTVQ